MNILKDPELVSSLNNVAKDKLEMFVTSYTFILWNFILTLIRILKKQSKV